MRHYRLSSATRDGKTQVSAEYSRWCSSRQRKPGVLTPPSIIVIVYGAMSDTLVGQLFISGIIPGSILSGACVDYIAIRVKVQLCLKL